MAVVLAECRAALGGGQGGSSSSGGGGGGSALVGGEPELMGVVEGVLSSTAGNLNSMLQDAVQGGRTEVDYLNGYVVKRAAARGVAAPLNEMLVRLIHAREAVPPALRTHEELR
ncbi:MAG: ketopantoate reductase PanE/ApbA C terminal-domain-containing protein [Monoraphidium minutum]|nr:MAG: ketopantoate reductase PanE/ApbA C terminal-domain-containing protein [Monoraphidium minutum]